MACAALAHLRNAQIRIVTIGIEDTLGRGWGHGKLFACITDAARKSFGTIGQDASTRAAVNPQLRAWIDDIVLDANVTKRIVDILTR